MRVPDYIRKVFDTLPNINRRDVVTFLVCLLVSAFFWVAQSAYLKSDKTITVALRIEGQPEDAVFTTHVPSQLKVTLYDNNIHLLKYSSKSSGVRLLTVDFGRYADVAGNFRISGAELQSLLLNELSSTTQITAISPALIDARYALTKGKKVPVALQSNITMHGNFRDFTPSITPDSVLIHAPNFILDTLSCVYTEPLMAMDLQDTLTSRVPLVLNVGVRATPDSVDVLVPVNQYVEKRFESVPIRVNGLPSDVQMVLFPHTVSMTCLANFRNYNKFTADDFVFSVSYDDVRADQSRQYLPVSFQTLLSDMEVYGVRFEPHEVEFSIEYAEKR
ncbi:MAG: hypothetical protein KBT20_04800 [Bacteroidales bacterium]|nr:hypothetical protein [Candidatus Liminaster caballi]